MSENSGFWVVSGLMWLAFLGKAPGLRHNRDPLYVLVCGVLLLGGTCFACANPDVIGVVNAATGIANVSAPLVYAMLTVESALVLTLIIYWRDWSPEKAGRWVRWLMVAYGLAVIGIVALFALGDAPVERRVDFDPYYARTPFIREMILLYLAAHTVAGVMATVLCVRWAAGVTGPKWLRRGLRVLILGFALNIGLDGSKLLAIAARWCGGTRWDWLDSEVSRGFAFACTLFTGIGFVLPMVGGSVERTLWAKRVFLRLGPLWRALREATPAVAAALPVPWWDVELKATRRVAEVQDGRLALRPYRNPDVARAAAARASALRLAPAKVAAAVEAAVLVDAMAAKAASGDAEPPLLDDGTATALPALDQRALLRVSRMIRRPPFHLTAATPAVRRIPAGSGQGPGERCEG
ncbi:MAB_1171c family putative transporter [Streptomyces goshikiensis]|uniref:MAB_1171c family putative transporter n=1 Tax=Streptomyces TaxID=1883 RepID=UPI000C271DBE|nr:MAB_1171c family putative transporter [Streptomyces sp. CB02120-2]PJN15487.1 hypothetical protein CG724_29040 [Streptomyces sp. CB02120-2]